jgi:aldose 1-epimerase
MVRYSVEQEQWHGEALFVLRDQETGAHAAVWPAFGSNCVQASLPGPDGRLVDVLLGPERPEQLREQPAWWGIPLLFPWPGRIPDGAFSFEGRPYRWPVLDAQGNAIHGFVKDRAWRVEGTTSGDEGASISCNISSEQYPEILQGFPFPFQVAATYQLGEDGLTLRCRVENVGKGALPFGFGAHPYLRIPVAPEGTRDACRVTIPADRRWNLLKVGQLAESTSLTLEEVTDLVGADNDLRRPRPLAGLDVDGGWTALRVQEGRTECAVTDPVGRVTLAMQASPNFPTLVVWSPPGRSGICFEPWTAPPNVFNLAARGLKESGLVVLAPGEQWEGWMRLLVRAAPW